MGARPRISTYAASLADEGFAGQVCGVFRSGMDVSAGAGKILYLGSFEKPLSCIGAQLPASWIAGLLGAVAAGDSVAAKDGRLVFARNQRPYLVLDLSAADAVDLSLEAPLSAAAKSALVQALQDAHLQDGIGLPADAALECVLDDLSCFAGGMHRDPHAAISWLIGRGLGLTPAGDDILCGFGAGLAAAGKQELHGRFLDELGKARMKRHTTEVSESYLDAMAEGFVNEGICALFEAAENGERLSEPIQHARDYGHTSGTDMLLGLLLGLDGFDAQQA
ncbi:MAG: DUF2877 domain-containing protein [Atopobiaceae bacterium]